MDARTPLPPGAARASGAWVPFRDPVHYLGLPASLAPPIWRERRAAAELAALRRARPAPPPAPAPDAPVLVVPGFLAGDRHAEPVRRWLRSGGWDARASGIASAVRCSSRDLELAEETLHALAEESGRPVTLVGHSRGGLFAKALAVRHPERVRELVTLGAPLTDPFAVHLALRLLSAGMAGATRLGLRDWVRECPFGECCRAVHDDVLAPAPADVPFTSVVSRSDGVVSWRSGLDPDARWVEVDGSHSGMLVNPVVWAAIAEALAS